MSNIIHFSLRKPVAHDRRNEEYLARADHVVLSALFQGLIKNDPISYRILLNAALRQGPKPVLKISKAEAELITSSSFNELYKLLFSHRIKPTDEN